MHNHNYGEGEEPPKGGFSFVVKRAIGRVAGPKNVIAA